MKMKYIHILKQAWGSSTIIVQTCIIIGIFLHIINLGNSIYTHQYDMFIISFVVWVMWALFLIRTALKIPLQMTLTDFSNTRGGESK